MCVVALKLMSYLRAGRLILVSMKRMQRWGNFRRHKTFLYPASISWQLSWQRGTYRTPYCRFEL